MKDVRFQMSRTLRQLGSELAMGDEPITVDEVMGWVLRRMLETGLSARNETRREPAMSGDAGLFHSSYP